MEDCIDLKKRGRPQTTKKDETLSFTQGAEAESKVVNEDVIKKKRGRKPSGKIIDLNKVNIS